MKSKGIGLYICVGSIWGGFRIQTDLGLRIVLGYLVIAFTSYDIDWVIGVMARKLEKKKMTDI